MFQVSESYQNEHDNFYEIKCYEQYTQFYEIYESIKHD